jgi:tetratricopeptide (TPR) repeat protein
VVVPVDGRYQLVGDVGELAVPESLHGLLAARLDALDPAIRALVADAAVVGASFPAEALIAVSGADEPVVRAGLSELVHREVLEVSADPLSPQRGAYRFTHGLLRQVAYDTQSRRDRRTRHLKVAAHLRSAFADDGEEVADVLARHYRDALDALPDNDDPQIRGEAITMSVRAAERALRAGAPATASDSYIAAAELASDNASGNAPSYWEKAARAADLAARYDQEQECAERARAEYLAVGDERAAARCAVVMGRALRRLGQLSAARGVLNEALEVLRAEPDADTVEMFQGLAGIANFDGGEDADQLSEENLRLAQSLGSGNKIIADAMMSRGLFHTFHNRRPQAVAYLREAARLAELAGANETRARALLNLTDVLTPVDPDAAIEASLTAAASARRVGDRDHMTFSLTNLINVYLETGDWDAAQRTLDDCDAEGLGQQGYVPIYRVMLAGLRGDMAPGAAALDAIPARLRSSEDRQDQAIQALARAMIAVASGDQAEALAQGRVTLASIDVIGVAAEPVRWAWPTTARAAYGLGDLAAVRSLLAMLDSYDVGHLVPLLRAYRDLARAWLAEKDPAAEAGFSRALTQLRRIRAPYWLAHALLDHAEWPASLGDGAAALEVQEAYTIAEQLRCRPLSQRALDISSRLSVDLTV